VLTTLLKMGQVADEFSVGASMLSINRSLPVSMYDKFNYRQKIENHFNKKLARAYEHAPNKTASGKPLQLDFDRFVSDGPYASHMEYLVDGYSYAGHHTVEAVNLLSLARHAPHINAYLKANASAEQALKGMAPVYAKTEQIIKAVASTSSDPYRNVTQDEYGAVVRYLAEVQVHEFIKDKSLTLPALSDGTDLTFDLSKNEHVSAFVYYFPEYLDRLKQLNPTLQSNPFFQRLAKKTDAKGQYLHIPNIEQLSENVVFDLRFGLNGQAASTSLDTGHGQVSHQDMLGQLFLYALIVGKGKVSKSSFFELFEPPLRKQFGYTDFLSRKGADPLAAVDTSPKSLQDNLHVQLALPGYAEKGDPFVFIPTIDLGYHTVRQNNLATYSPNPEIPAEALPSVISLWRNGERKLYQLTGLTGNRTLSDTKEYSMVQPRFPLVALSANTDGKPTHVTANRLKKTITDPVQVEQLLRGEKTKIDIRVPVTLTSSKVQAVTNLGTIEFDRTVGKGTLMASRLLDAPSRHRETTAMAPVKAFVKAMTERLQEKFPFVNVEWVDTDGMVALFGEAERGTKAMADGNTVYYNEDMVSPDMAMHEFGHIFLWTLKANNPELYSHITKLALQENGFAARQVRRR
jgi:hypothetical protein